VQKPLNLALMAVKHARQTDVLMLGDHVAARVGQDMSVPTTANCKASQSKHRQKPLNWALMAVKHARQTDVLTLGDHVAARLGQDMS
jgi:ABC-type Fe3+-siderophore transport system permease subunit